MHKHRRFLLLLGLYIIGVLVHGATLPVMEGSDEPIHYTYVELVRTDHRLPDRTNVRQNSTRQESGQPPLTYWLAAQTANLLNLPSPGDDEALAHMYTVRNEWITPPNPLNRRDNMNHYLHGRGESAFGNPDIVTAIRALRLTSLVWGVIAVVGAYGAAREVFRREGWALTATAAYAFMPTFLQISSYFNNDISAVALATLVTWQTLRLLRRGAAIGRLLVIGVLLAAGGLSKVSALLVAPGVGLALVFLAFANRVADAQSAGLPVTNPYGSALKRLIGYGVLVALPVILLFGPWVAWGAIVYNDPFGTLTHRNPTLSYTELLSLGEVAVLLPEVYLSYWGKFGLAKIYFTAPTYAALSAILVLSLFGYGSWLVRRLLRRDLSVPAVKLWQALILAVTLLAVFAGLVRWMQEIAVITGRLLYPAHIAVAIGLTGGLALLAQRLPRLSSGLRIYAVGLLAVSSIIYAPAAIYTAYRTPRLLSPNQLPSLQGEPLDYDDTIRLLGYTQPSPLITEPLHPLTLCWEVLQPTDRPAAFSVKFVRDGVIVADRTSFHGLGHYDSSQWRPGDRFCDDIEIPLDDPDIVGDPLPEPATAYNILVVVLSARTRDVDWQPTLIDGTPIDFPGVGSVISPAGDMSAHMPDSAQPLDAQFDGLAALTSVATAGVWSAGESVDIWLRWSVTGKTGANLKQFIHLSPVDSEAGEQIVLADGLPRTGAYPTWAWSPGEVLVDRWQATLPDDLPPGEYALNVGLYNPDTGARLAVTQDGMAVAERSAALPVRVD